MNEARNTPFDTSNFLAKSGTGRAFVTLKGGGIFFAQGNNADSVFYIQRGRAKLTVVSQEGKEATLTLLSAGDFIGEESLACIAGLRLATASAITPCSGVKIDRAEMIRLINEEKSFSNMFLEFLVARSMRVQADFVDQLFNSTEKRLARILLLMADNSELAIPKISQETLAEMIGTTRSRVNVFMNRFRRLGFVDYNGRIYVHQSLSEIIRHAEGYSENAEKCPELMKAKLVCELGISEAGRES